MYKLDPSAVEYHIVHCSDSRDDGGYDSLDVKAWHTNPKPIGNAWSDTGYHYVIERDGKAVMARSLKYAGAHCYGKNGRSVATCLMGRNDFTEAQMKALEKIHEQFKYMFKGIKLVGHYELDSKKTCPNFNPSVELNKLKEQKNGI